MKILLVIILGIVLSLEFTQLHAETIKISGFSEIHELPNEFSPHLVTHCEIYDRSAKLLLRLPFNRCQFADDGSYVGGTNNTLFFYNHKSEQVKKYDLFPHHDIFTTKNGDYLVLGSDFEKIDSKLYRLDVLYRFSKEGELKAKYEFKNKFFEQLKNLLMKLDITSVAENWLKEIGGDFYEFTHANSAYEDLNGNIVINLGTLKVAVVLNYDFSSLISGNRTRIYTLHDLQPFHEGKYLGYINKHEAKSQISQLVILNSNDFSLLKSWEFDSPIFYSEVVGGVQLINNNFLLFSDYVDSVSNINILDIKNNKRFIFKMPELTNSRKIPIQSIKNVNLHKFLSNNKRL